MSQHSHTKNALGPSFFVQSYLKFSCHCSFASLVYIPNVVIKHFVTIVFTICIVTSFPLLLITIIFPFPSTPFSTLLSFHILSPFVSLSSLSYNITSSLSKNLCSSSTLTLLVNYISPVFLIK
jgi:hypothetical protein